MKKIFYIGFLSLTTSFFLACDSQKNTSTSPENNLATATGTEQTAHAGPIPDTNQDTTTADQTSPTTATTFASDADFVAKAAQSGMAEVKLGNLAERKAVDPEVKKFGVKMVEEHTRANALLMNLARQKKWQTPEEMDAAHQAVYQKLTAVMSDEFDRLYMQQMVQDHEMAVAMFQQGAGMVKDPELKTYINNTIPALKNHLEMARSLEKNINTRK